MRKVLGFTVQMFGAIGATLLLVVNGVMNVVGAMVAAITSAN